MSAAIGIEADQKETHSEVEGHLLTLLPNMGEKAGLLVWCEAVGEGSGGE